MELSGLTILSMPLGPREVRTTSATAIERRDGSEGWLGDVLGDLTFGGDDVGLTDVLGLFRLDLGGGITGFGGGSLIFRHLNLESLIVL